MRLARCRCATATPVPIQHLIVAGLPASSRSDKPVGTQIAVSHDHVMRPSLCYFLRDFWTITAITRRTARPAKTMV
jgi:hypothetical protein